MISLCLVTQSTQLAATSLPSRKVRLTYLYFPSLWCVVANFQGSGTVPICNKLHILANSSAISPLSSFKPLGRMPSVPVIYLHLQCHSRTICPFTITCSKGLDVSVFKYNWGVGIFLFNSMVTAWMRRICHGSVFFVHIKSGNKQVVPTDLVSLSFSYCYGT